MDTDTNMNMTVAYIPAKKGFFAGVRPFITDGTAEIRTVVTSDPHNACSYSTEHEMWQAICCIANAAGISVPRNDIIVMTYKIGTPAEEGAKYA